MQVPTTPAETRPDNLEKTGSIRSKIRLDPKDFGNDQPPRSDDDSDLESIFKDKAVPPKPVRNIPSAEQPGSPDSLSLLGDGGRGVDTGNDGRKSRLILSTPPTKLVFTYSLSLSLCGVLLASRLRVTTYGQEFWVAFLDNRVENPMNTPLELYVVAAHYATDVKATVKMW